MQNHSNFLQGITEKRKVLITYFSQKEEKNVTRLCAPFDFGPKRMPKSIICSDYADGGADKYHFWDFDGPSGWHISSKDPQEIREIQIMDDSFDPRALIDFTKLRCPWHIERNW